ncbi:MAG: rhombotarget lipoprotein [bacterium]|nr:rhombotarget lipoprotein [bacterium]
MYGIDVIALMSYDQVQFTTQDALSLTYWTIVGAYIVPAEKNDTHTLIDAAVFDIESRKMLFRAPGTSLVKGRAAPIDLQGKLKRDSVRGFEKAGEDLIANLDVALADLQQRVKDRPDDYEISSRPGYSGDAGALMAALTAGAALAARLGSTRKRA